MRCTRTCKCRARQDAGSDRARSAHQACGVSAQTGHPCPAALGHVSLTSRLLCLPSATPQAGGEAEKSRTYLTCVRAAERRATDGAAVAPTGSVYRQGWQARCLMERKNIAGGGGRGMMYRDVRMSRERRDARSDQTWREARRGPCPARSWRCAAAKRTEPQRSERARGDASAGPELQGP